MRVTVKDVTGPGGSNRQTQQLNTATTTAMFVAGLDVYFNNNNNDNDDDDDVGSRWRPVHRSNK